MSDPRDDGKDGTDELQTFEDAYSIEYLRECASGESREERLAELRRRIEKGAYRPDIETVAEELIRRGDLD